MINKLLSDLNLSNFVTIDIESTGLDYNKDKIIEISACKYNNGVLSETYTKLVNPQIHISKFITDFTGISNNDVIDKPSFDEISDDFFDFIHNLPIVGHNVEFDLKFINKELDPKSNISKHGYICDTYYLSRIFLYFLESFKLTSICNYFKIEVRNAHRAEDDAKLTAELFLHLINVINTTDINILSKLHRCMGNKKIYNNNLINYFILMLIEKNNNNKNSVLHSHYRFIYENFNDDLNSFSYEDFNLIFDKSGILSQKIENYEFREEQFNFSKDCYKFFSNSDILIGEAGTGIGKSFSYLIASLIYENKKKVIISTSTHSLQEQLFLTDIPIISKVLNKKIKCTIMKGMNNYICKNRIDILIEKNEDYLSNEEILEFLSIIAWSEYTLTGDISECNSFLKKYNYKIWNLIKYEKEVCSFKDGIHDSECFYKLMKKESQDSDILIVNHSLLASSYSSQDTFINNDNICVIDEAHKIVENCREQLKSNINLSMLNSLQEEFIAINNKFHNVSDNMQYNKNSSIINNQLIVFKENFKIFSNEFVESIINDTVEYNRKVDVRYSSIDEKFKTISIRPENIIKSLEDIISTMNSHCMELDTFKMVSRTHKSNYKSLIAKCKNILDILLKLFYKTDDMINWVTVNVYKKNIQFISFNTVPYNIQNFVKEFINKFKSTILCSATLSINGDYDYFINDIGLDTYINDKEVKCKTYPSSFYYEDQTKMYVLDSNLNLNSHDYFKSIFQTVSELSKELNKRMLILCTAYKQIEIFKGIYQKEYIHSNMNILFQDYNISKQILLNRYLSNTNSILFGTNTFWEGIDLPNDKLSVLIIIKVPFSNPKNPIVESKIEYMNSLGCNAFLEYQLPEAILKLRQGIGRLIRNQDDMGVCIITDPRLLRKKYGRELLESLPTISEPYSNINSLIRKSKKFLGC